MKYPTRSDKSRRGVAKMIITLMPGHHAHPLAPLKEALQDACDLTGLPHAVGSWKGGTNSNYVRFPNITLFFKGIADSKDPRITMRFRAMVKVAATIRNKGQAFKVINKYAK